MKSTKAHCYLVLITIIWGMTFPLIHNALSEVDPFVFVTARFVLASFVLFPFVCCILHRTDLRLFLGGAVLGLINSIFYICQTVGLQTIKSAQSAFITGASIIFIPFLMPLFKLGKPKRLDLLCVAICLFGLYFLTGAELRLSTGELWTLAGAVTLAVQIIFLQWLTQKPINYSAQLLTFYQLIFTIPLAFIFSVHKNFNVVFHVQALIGILFCAIGASVIAYVIQNKYQKDTTAMKAALIFTLEPICATLFGWMINREQLTWPICLGGFLILISLALPTFFSLWESFTYGQEDR